MPKPKKKSPYKPPANPPKFKKDGTPYVPWAEEVALRLKVREEKIAAGEVEDRTGRCNATTTGVHGPKRPCMGWAVRGTTVCLKHGAATKHVKNAAKRRLLEQLDPTISRLVEIRDQSEHMPSALGASVHILNRVLGKPDAVDKDKGAGRAIINVGIAIGAIPNKNATVTVKALPAGDEALDGETVDDSDDE